MNYTSRTNQELVEEISALKQRIEELERSKTEGIGSDRARREGKALLKTYLEDAPDGIYVSDMRGNLLYCNRRCEVITGYGKEELIGKNVLESHLLSEGSLGKAAGLLEAGRAGRSTGPDEIEVINKDGRAIFIEINTSVIENMGERVIFGFVRDITERKQERESLLRTQFAMDRAPDSVLWVDDGGCIVYANDSACTSMGFTREELLKMKVFDIDPDFPPDNWEEHKENMRRLGAMTFESRHTTKDGSSFPVEVSTNLFGFDDGFLACAFDRDITARKETERKIIESEKSLSAILAASPIGIGKVRGRTIVWVNETVCRFSGHTQEELQGRSVSVFYESEEEFERVGKLLYRQGYAEGKMLRADGAIRDMSIQVSPADRDSYIFTVSDVTQHKKAEESLRFAQFAMDRASDIVMWVKADGTIFYANDSACGALGYSRDELLSMTVFDVDPTYPHEAWADSWNRVRQTGSLVIEASPRRKDGTVFSVEISGNFLNYEGTEYVCDFMRDITERRRMEDTLRHSEERFHALFESAGDAILITKDTIVDCNDRTLAMFGCTRESLVGQSLRSFSPAVQPSGRDSDEAASERVQACLEGRPQFFEWKYLRADGMPFDAEVSLTRIDIRGEAYLQAIIRDVTKRKQTEEELRRLSIAIEQAVEEVIITDPEGIIQYVNPAFENITGYSREDAIGQTPRIVKSGVHDKVFYDNLWNIIKNGNTWTGQITNRRKDGTLIQEDATISPLINSSGQLTGYVSLKRDITEEVKLHSQLRQAQKMESIGTLAGGIAHDFNNILTALMGYAALMEMKMDRDNPLLSYVNQILSASTKAADLTRSLLTFSRQQPVTLVPLDINDALEATKKLLKRLLTEDIELHTSLTGDDTVVMADKSQIDQILFNLVTNARDAMPKGGALAIETRVVDMDGGFISIYGFGEPGRYVLISIRDSGEGMDQATREKIFDPFFTTKEMGRGTGLGLATVYGIVKQHNGYITVDSEPERGTTFNIYLPAVDMKTGVQEHETVPIHRGNETVLIAEDDGEVRGFMREALRRYGYKIIEAANGEEAIDKFKGDRHIDVVILDSVMPKKNGREVYEEMRTIDPGARVLFMSGYTRDVVLDKGIEEGKFDFIAKPLFIDKLLQKVREILDR